MNRRPSGRPKKMSEKIWTSSMDVQSTNCRIMDGNLDSPLKPQTVGWVCELRAGPACRMWNPKWESGPFPAQKKKPDVGRVCALSGKI